MTRTVPVPVWLLIALAAGAAWAVYAVLARPIARWLLTHQSNTIIDDVSRRLRIGIRPFQRIPRHALVGRLLADPQLQRAAEQHAADRGVPLPAAFAHIERYAHEIVPAFNAYVYFRAAYWVARRIAQFLYRVRVGLVDAAALAAVEPTATVVFVMNHRSNMDYVLVGYLVAEHTALSYAVGEWARIWPLSSLIRATGAFFVRRHSQDPLYRRVLERYVTLATEAGVPQALFPEGRLTRDGRLCPPRFGVLDYMLRGFRTDGERDLVFVPIGLNYDRVLEDRTQLLALDPERERTSPWVALWRTCRFAGHNLLLLVRRRWHRFGYACVNVGAPISMRRYCSERTIEFSRLGADERRDQISALGHHLMAAIERLVPVLPVPMIAHLIARAEAPLSELDLKTRVVGLIEQVERAGGRVHVPRRDLEYAVTSGLRMLRERHLILERDGLYSVDPEEAPLLRYYANSIAHLLGIEAEVGSRESGVGSRKSARL
jgi:glycerol-3-phosphate O-acyltransferase